jgi:3-oxoacyl-[acyl-carrier-protein] synthase-3
MAGRQALSDSGIDPETLDQIVVAHNFGDVACGSTQSQNVPALAARVKHILGIRRPECIAYDILAGCPGWVHCLIQSHAWFRAGMAKKVLLIGAETLSRVLDPADRNSMIFADGAGACVLESRDAAPEGPGILGTSAQTHSAEEVDYINMGKSFRRGGDTLFIKMKGRKVYEYALKHVPAALTICLIWPMPAAAGRHAHEHPVAREQLRGHGSHALPHDPQGRNGRAGDQARRYRAFCIRGSRHEC